MLGLIQLINYMLVTLEYSKDEVEGQFAMIADGELSLVDLIDSVGLEFHPAVLKSMQEKLPKWKSALFAVTMVRGEQ